MSKLRTLTAHRRKGWGGLLVTVATLWPGMVSACDFYLAYSPLGSQSAGIAVAGGVQVFPLEGAEGNGYAPHLSVTIPLGDRIVLQPAVGYCSYRVQRDWMVGGGISIRLFGSETWSLGVQGHAGHMDHGEDSTTVLPVVTTANFLLGDFASLHAGVGVRYARYAEDPIGASYDADLTAFGGITVPLSDFDVSAGVVLTRGEPKIYALGGGVSGGEEAEVSFGAAVQLPLGG